MPYIPKATHYASSKPTVVLMEFPEGDAALPGLPEGLSVITDEEAQPVVFSNFSKASKYVANNVEERLHKYVRYVNETPIEGGGDREATNNRKCLKCKGFLRPGMTQKIAGFEYTDMVCPVCDRSDA